MEMFNITVKGSSLSMNKAIIQIQKGDDKSFEPIETKVNKSVEVETGKYLVTVSQDGYKTISFETEVIDTDVELKVDSWKKPKLTVSLDCEIPVGTQLKLNEKSSKLGSGKTFDYGTEVKIQIESEGYQIITDKIQLLEDTDKVYSLIKEELNNEEIKETENGDALSETIDIHRDDIIPEEETSEFPEEIIQKETEIPEEISNNSEEENQEESPQEKTEILEEISSNDIISEIIPLLKKNNFYKHLAAGRFLKGEITENSLLRFMEEFGAFAVSYDDILLYSKLQKYFNQ